MPTAKDHANCTLHSLDYCKPYSRTPAQSVTAKMKLYTRQSPTTVDSRSISVNRALCSKRILPGFCPFATGALSTRDIAHWTTCDLTRHSGNSYFQQYGFMGSRSIGPIAAGPARPPLVACGHWGSGNGFRLRFLVRGSRAEHGPSGSDAGPYFRIDVTNRRRRSLYLVSSRLDAIRIRYLRTARIAERGAGSPGLIHVITQLAGRTRRQCRLKDRCRRSALSPDVTSRRQRHAVAPGQWPPGAAPQRS